ncbi:hypothetical protein INS49_001577 [Diaporthe citri]|uniref:uncharacterized protein n=1 Tax=Diaporthe citri TaxID=83186 RepID=UPI001C7EF358|nr:uncharacterized protein INS49_001577 [Diaporthe citri]KAG6367388.1 hypothetical protein INS49_001577 [Diaporthe citri]
MKTATLAALASGAAAQWWGGAPDCAQSCLSSKWASSTPTSAWPEPTSYCDGDDTNSVGSCLSSACSATPTAWSSYSSASSSICAAWSSCSSVGSTGVYTVSWPAASGGWGPGGGSSDGWSSSGRSGFGGGNGGRGGGGGGWGGWTSSYTASQVTVTGCPWDGSPWIGPGGDGDNAGWGGWGAWGHGWTWSTHSTTVTETVTGSNGNVVVSTGLAQVAEAVSGDVTSTTTLTGSDATATATASSSSSTSSGSTSNAVAGAKVDRGVIAAGAVLGGLVGVMAVL